MCCIVCVLQGKIAIVDTPGLGDIDQQDVAKRMMDYLPNALAFVFVINVAAAGGLQKDRVKTISCFTSFYTIRWGYCLMLLSSKTYYWTLLIRILPLQFIYCRVFFLQKINVFGNFICNYLSHFWYNLLCTTILNESLLEMSY